MKKFILFTLLASLAGCATLDGLMLDNRIACTAAKDKSFVVSQWGRIGISSQISDLDTQVVCK